MPATDQQIQTVAFVSLGCPKNLVDSEKMLGTLAEAGLVPIADEDAADAIVINTCGFLEASKDESIDEIERAIERKKAGTCKRVIVAGCLVQRHRAKMLQWCPDIDAMIGVFDRDRILDAVRPSVRPDSTGRVLDGSPKYSSIAASALAAKRERNIDAAGYFESDASRLRLTPRHYAYLRISEGCNQNCAFCTIPSIRGKMRSKPIDAIRAEARELFADGAFELNLIGQDTTSYGEDIGYTPGLVGMLETLDRTATEATGGAWLRLMYAYPSCFTDEMIDAIARLHNVVKYIDIPLQHINDRVLDSMRRRTSRALIETLLGKLRQRVPNIAIRTTFISGYPGETDAEHRELVDFIGDFGFDAMGVFPYSPEPGTPAGTMYDAGGAVHDEIIQERIEQLMLVQQDIVFARNEQLAADERQVEVLIDEPAEHLEASDGMHLYKARCKSQAPDVDAVTYVASQQPLAPGEVIRCRIVDANEYDLVAQPVADLEPRVQLPVIG
jgi:ribosomal protein S12 methylthiotransferase